jgi:DnaK suppressor protein
MATEPTKHHPRQEALRAILDHERTQALARVREYRSDQEQETTPPPGDEMDAARSLAEIETHATLIERVEDRLKAIDFAFDRLDRGLYGICAQCGEEIPLERLKALPFAAYCVDCQEKRNHQRPRSDQTWIDEPFIRRWDLPEEMTESTEESRDEFVALPTGEEEGERLAVEKAQPSGSTGRVRKPRAPRTRHKKARR